MRKILLGAALLQLQATFTEAFRPIPYANGARTCMMASSSSLPLSRRSALVSAAAGISVSLSPTEAGAYARAPKAKKPEGDPVIVERKNASQNYAAAMMAKDEKSLALMLADEVTLQSERGAAKSRTEVLDKLKLGYTGYGDVSETGLTAKYGGKTYKVALEFDSGEGTGCWPASDERCRRKLRIVGIKEDAK